MRFEYSERDHVAQVDLWYPNVQDGETSEVRVGLVSVRAADDIVIRYDFDRDGWAILMERTIDRGDWMEETGIWDEMAFVPAWNERHGDPDKPGGVE